MKRLVSTMKFRFFVFLLLINLMGIGVVFGISVLLIYQNTLAHIKWDVNILMNAIEADIESKTIDPIELVEFKGDSVSSASLQDSLGNFLLIIPQIHTITIYKTFGDDLESLFIMRDAGVVVYEWRSISEDEITNVLGEPDVLSKIRVSDQLSRDGKNTYTSGYSPLFTSDGRIMGFMEIVFDVSEAVKLLRQNILYLSIIAVILLFTLGLVGWYQAGRMTTPIIQLTEDVNRFSGDNFNIKTGNYGYSEINNLSELTEQTISAIKRQKIETEQQLIFRNAELELWTNYMESAVIVTQKVVSILDFEKLVYQIVELIREQFSFYYVGLFLLDTSHDWAFLRAGTGKPGKILLEQKQRIRYGEGIIGWVLENKESRISMEVGKDAARLSSQELPLARSQAVLPLITRGRNIGALSIHSEKIGRFDKLLLDVLQQLADIVAISIDNSRLYKETEDSYLALHESLQKISGQAWVNYIKKRTHFGYTATEYGIINLPPDNLYSYLDRDKQGLSSDESGNLIIPIVIRGQKLGLLHARKPVLDSGGVGFWSDQEKKLINDLLEHLTIALDNARLYNAAQQSAEREKLLSEITSQVRSSTNVNTIMRTAIKELAEALQVPKGSITFRPIEEIYGDHEGGKNE